MKSLKPPDFTDPQTIKDLIEALDRPIIFLWSASLHVTRLTPLGCIRVEDEREEDGDE